MQDHCIGTGNEPSTNNSITHNNHEGAPQPAISTGAAGKAGTAAAPQAPAGGVNSQGGTTPPGQGAPPASGACEGPYQLRDQAKAQRWANIPEELKWLDQWALADVNNTLKLVDKDTNKQPLYYGLSCDASDPNNPIIHHSIRPAAVDNPSTWMSFEAATQWADLYGMEIGFILNKVDPYCIVDLDIKPETQDNIRDGIQKHVEDYVSKHTYVERSTGGVGYHIVVKAALPAGGRRREHVEIYDNKRFIIFTGNVESPLPLPIDEGQEYINGWLQDMDAANVPTGYEDQPATKTDEEALQAACKAKNGERFYNLYMRADFTGFDRKANGEPNYSDADAYLVQHLCFHTPSNEQVERLWLASALGTRPKVIQREDYRKGTIRSMRAKCERDKQTRAAEAERLKQALAPALDRKLAQQQAQQAAQSTDNWLINIADVFTNPPPPPEFLTEQLMPAGEVTLLAAHGGAGKSILMLQWAVHAALGMPFLGKPVTKAPVVFVSAEDKPNIIRYRFATICRQLGCNPADVAEHLTVINATDDPILFQILREGFIERPYLTHVYNRLREEGNRVGARYFFVDNASDTFDANENQRIHVRAFIRTLRDLGRERDAGIVLAAHVNKQTAQGALDSQSYSGSTAWHNSVRSRLSLGPGEQNGVILTHEKTNYGRTADPFHLAWNSNGLLYAIDHVARNANIAERVLSVMQQLIENGDNIPTAATGSRTVHHVLSEHPEYPQWVTSRKTKDILLRLEADGKIKKEVYKTKNRHPSERWLLA